MGNILLENAVYYLDAAVLDIHKPEHQCRLAILRAQLLSLARDIAEDQEGMGCRVGRGHRKRGRRQTLRGGSLRARLNGLARVNA
jgi:hypothetical protein